MKYIRTWSHFEHRTCPIWLEFHDLCWTWTCCERTRRVWHSMVDRWRGNHRRTCSRHSRSSSGRSGIRFEVCSCKSRCHSGPCAFADTSRTWRARAKSHSPGSEPDRWRTREIRLYRRQWSSSNNYIRRVHFWFFF